MRLGKVLDILYATLLNEPYISSFNTVTCELNYPITQDLGQKNVKGTNVGQENLQGALFFALDKQDIAEAIRQGVYGVVFEGETRIIDNEIAWISVADIHASIKRFIRYLIGQSKSNVVLVSLFELYILKNIAPHLVICEANSLAQSLEFFYAYYKHSGIKDSIHCVGSQDYSTQFITKTQRIKHNVTPLLPCIFASIYALQGIDVPKFYSYQYTKILEFPHQNVQSADPISTSIKLKLMLFSFSLLESKVIYNNVLYTIGMPFIFLPFIESALALLEAMALRYSVRDSTTQENNLFEQGDNTKTSVYHLKSLQNFELFEVLKQRFSSPYASTKLKTLIFCKNPSILNIGHLEIQDFYSHHEATLIMQEILPIIKKSTYIDITLTEYFNSQAKHLQLLSLFSHQYVATAKNRTKSSEKHIKLTFAHNTHLYEILSKTPFDIAIIYGISKAEFIKLESTYNNGDSTTQSKGQQYFFE
ncbi:hypothetical protein [Helicobacter sp. MIT 14-3879]|uniref:hypothetical protein n=1 Tax=Helicobacter sp. MIT 14-3879 TaxID=2040649 RepID=UPI000E1EA710|nr:hypothetical protein [Helicobacter sp. MIT 14-3879]RDU61370.1 hypothetical protein CQA44_09220 [Helicobacter sp. MIT 14-3879]